MGVLLGWDIRWFCYVYRNLNTAPWTKEEDDYIVKSYQLGKSWASITAAIPGRTKDAIQQRFNDVLKPTLSLPVERRWSESEDQLLINAMSKETALKIDWVRVSNIVSCKSIRQCQGRWTVLLRLKRAPPRTVRVTPLLTKPESTDVPEPSVA